MTGRQRLPGQRPLLRTLLVAARICRPSDVHRNRTASAAITTTATTSTNRSYGDSSGTPPTTIAVSSNGTRIGR